MDGADSPKASLAICIASGRQPCWQFTYSLANLVGMLPGTGLFKMATIDLQTGYATDQARCFLAQRALKGGYDKLLFLDDDMGFPADTVTRLMSHNKPIIAANYVCRVFPVQPLAMKGAHRVYSNGKTGLEQVDRAPSGVMLIDTSVFAKLTMPWFQTTFQPHDPENWMSDDVWFCDKARQAGYEIWVDHDLSLQVQHINNFPFHHGLVEVPAEAKSLADMAKELVA